MELEGKEFGRGPRELTGHLANPSAQAPTQMDIYARMAHLQEIVQRYSHLKDLGGPVADLFNELEAVMTMPIPTVPTVSVRASQRNRSSVTVNSAL